MITTIFVIALLISVIKSRIDRVEARIYCIYRIWRSEKNSILNNKFFKKELILITELCLVILPIAHTAISVFK